MFHQACLLLHLGYLTCYLLPPTLLEHHSWSQCFSAKLEFSLQLFRTRQHMIKVKSLGIIFINSNLYLGMTSLEVWCFACFSFTFSSLISYVIILIRIELKRNQLNQVKVDVASPQKAEPKKGKALEILLFMCSAGGFLVFNVFYWICLT